MDLSRPLRVVTPTLDGDVLWVLARADGQFSTGDIRRVLGQYSYEGVRRTLHRLVEQGIVLEQRAGSHGMYSLNRRHLAAGPIAELARLRDTVIDRTAALIAQWERPAAFVALFGSAARGEMRANSDLDVLVVRPPGLDADDPTWRNQLDGLAETLTAWTGNDTRILEYDAARIGERDEPVLRAVATEGLALYGPGNWLRRSLRATAGNAH